MQRPITGGQRADRSAVKPVRPSKLFRDDSRATIEEDEKQFEMERRNYFESESRVSSLNKRGFLRLNDDELTSYRRKGIHFSQLEGGAHPDLVYNFTNFERPNSKTISALTKRARYLRILKSIPLVGPEASSKGIDLYRRGHRFDAAHLDSFIKAKEPFSMTIVPKKSGNPNKYHGRLKTAKVKTGNGPLREVSGSVQLVDGIGGTAGILNVVSNPVAEDCLSEALIEQHDIKIGGQ